MAYGEKYIPLLLAILVIGVLCPSLPQAFGWFDSGEFVASAVGLGISHNPGYPVYNMIANGFLRLMPIGNIAYRLNLLSLLIMTGAFLFLGYGVRLMRSDGNRSAVPAALWTLSGFASTPLLRQQAMTNEIYALDLLFLSLAILAAIRTRQTPSVRTAGLFVFVSALAVINHYSALLWLPGVLLLIPRETFGHMTRNLSWMIMIILMAGSILIYLPIRAQANPLLNWNHPAELDSFLRHVTAVEHRHASIVRLNPDQRMDRMREFLRTIGSQYAPAAWSVMALLAIIAIRRISTAFIAAAVIAFGHLVYVLYLNVVPLVATPFGLPLLLALIFTISLALDRLSGRFRRLAPAAAAVTAGLALFIPETPAAMTGFSARTLGKAVLNACSRNAVLVPYTDTVTFAALALQASEHYRTDVMIVPDRYPGVQPVGYPDRFSHEVLQMCLKESGTAGHPGFARCVKTVCGNNREIYAELRPETALKMSRLYRVSGPIWIFEPSESAPGPDGPIDAFVSFYTAAIGDEVGADVAATMLNTLGLQLQGSSRYEEARKVFLRVLEVQPGCREAMINLGTLAWGDGDISGAAAWMQWARSTHR